MNVISCSVLTVVAVVLVPKRATGSGLLETITQQVLKKAYFRERVKSTLHIYSVCFVQYCCGSIYVRYLVVLTHILRCS